VPHSATALRLDRKLKLPVNEQKSQVAKISEVTFLGFCFRGTKLRGTDAARDDFKHRIRQLTAGNSGDTCGPKVRNLLALGTYKRQAILTAISSKSDWRLSKTLATHSGMTNDGLKQQGLISFRDLWIKAQSYV